VTSIDPAGTGPVQGDPDRLQQAIWNVLANAIKFTPIAAIASLAHLLPQTSGGRSTLASTATALE